MRWYGDLPLSWKLLGAFALVMAFVVALSAFAYLSSSHSLESREAVERAHQITNLLDQAMISLLDMETGFRGYVLTGQQEFLEPYDRGRQAYQKHVRDLRQLVHDPQQAQRVAEIERLANSWQSDFAEPGIRLRRDVSAGRASLNDALAQISTAAGKRQFDAIRALMAEASQAEDARLAQVNAAETAASEQLRRLLIWGTVGVLALGVVIAVTLARTLADAVAGLGRAAHGITRGDLNQPIEVRSRDEVGKLGDQFRAMVDYLGKMAAEANAIAQGDLRRQIVPQSDQDALGLAFQRMVTHLRQMTAELQESAQNLSATSHEIHAAVSQQTSGAAEQSAAVAQTTATVDEVKASADQATQMAMVVSDSAEQATRVSTAGVEAVGKASAGMDELRERVQTIAENILALSEQSQQIGEIIATVSDLTDQSNLLALNAAIEASRAGEHGRGFAVVAAEIRALAEQSKAATTQVRTLLGDIQRATQVAVLATEQGTAGAERGGDLVAQAGQTIDELAHVIEETARSAH
jgi:methyl-accepting chemotaxis protein